MYPTKCLARLLCFYFPQLWVLEQKSVYFKKKLKIYAFIWILIWGNCQVLTFLSFLVVFLVCLLFLTLDCFVIKYLIYYLFSFFVAKHCFKFCFVKHLGLHICVKAAFFFFLLLVLNQQLDNILRLSSLLYQTLLQLLHQLKTHNVGTDMSVAPDQSNKVKINTFDFSKA